MYEELLVKTEELDKTDNRKYTVWKAGNNCKSKRREKSCRTVKRSNRTYSGDNYGRDMRLVPVMFWY